MNIIPAIQKTAVLIYLNSEHRDAMRALVKEKNPRKKNISSPEPIFTQPQRPWREETIHYKGAYKGWRGSEFIPVMQSCALLTDGGKTAHTYIDGTYAAVSAPAGCHFAEIDKALALVHTKTGHEMHVTSILPRLKKSELKRPLLEIVKTREAEKVKQKLAKKSESVLLKHFAAKNIPVTRENAYRAGQCVPGVEMFLKRIGIDKRESIPSGKLVKIYNKMADKLTEFQKARFIQVVRSIN
jgi:hypothetical protein